MPVCSGTWGLFLRQLALGVKPSAVIPRSLTLRERLRIDLPGPIEKNPLPFNRAGCSLRSALGKREMGAALYLSRNHWPYKITSRVSVLWGKWWCIAACYEMPDNNCSGVESRDSNKVSITLLPGILSNQMDVDNIQYYQSQSHTPNPPKHLEGSVGVWLICLHHRWRRDDAGKQLILIAGSTFPCMQPGLLTVSSHQAA